MELAFVLAGVILFVLGIRAAIIAASRGVKRAFSSKPDLSVLPPQFIVLDLETTGLKPDQHEIIEIGAIRVHRDSNKHDTFQALVKPSQKVPAKITELTGITQAMIDADGGEPATALRDLHSFVGDHRIVTFNAEFDMGFLHQAAARHGLRFSNDVSCALKMARRAWPGRKSYRLTDLARDGNLALNDEHRALGDCQRALHIYAAAASKLRSPT